MRAAGAAIAVLAGVALATQSRINGALGARLHDGVFAALVTTCVGLVVLGLALLITPAGRAGFGQVRAALDSGALRPWQCLGGVAGAAVVASQVVTATLGVSAFVIAIVAGQVGSSVAVDRFGLGPGGPLPPTGLRLAGAALTLVGVFGAMSGRPGGAGALWLLGLPLLAGAGQAVQYGINGRVRAAAGHALTAALINFAVAGVALLTVWLIIIAVRGPAAGLPAEPWLYLGGPLGVLFIGATVAVVRWTGVLLLGLASVSGQLLGAVLLDLLAPAPGVRLAGATVAGAAITLLAVAVAAQPTLPTRRAS